jgi:cytochrome c oxidase subunit 2
VRKSLIIQLLALSAVFGGIAFCVAWFIPWLPDSGAKQADRVHTTYWIASIICLVIFAIVAAVLVYSVVKFRARPDDPEDGKHIHGHTMLEIVWTAIPTVLVTVIAVISGVYLTKNENIASKHRVIEVKGIQFTFSFAYPELGGTAGEEYIGELHVPVNQPVELRMEGIDVIHSFWVPEWSIHQDMPPGTIQHLVMTPTKVGRFPIICSELCGLGHATMRNWVVVQSAADYEKWLQSLKKKFGGVEAGATTGAETQPTTTAPAETSATETTATATGPSTEQLAAGKALFTGDAGCASCHTLADAGAKGKVGPDLDKVLAGKDAEFIRTSIVDPNAFVEQGFQPNIMPQDYGKTLQQDQLDALVNYLLAVTNK